MGKYARLAHLHDLSHRTNAQPLQAHMGGQAQRCLDDGCAGLLSFGLPACPAPTGLTRGAGGAAAATAVAAKKKLSYMEAREFAAIEQQVEVSDERLAGARERVEDPKIASGNKRCTRAGTAATAPAWAAR